MTDQPSSAALDDRAVSTMLEREARIVGIKGFSTPTLEAVDRRRSQLWTVAFAGLVCLASAVALLSTNTGRHLGFASGTAFRSGTILLVIGLAVYVIEKERHLRRLAKLLVDERVLGAALSNRLKELAMLYEAGKAMNSVLVVDDVLRLILSSAFELLHSASGSIMLLDEAGELVAVCHAGDDQVSPLELGGSIAHRVVRDREPLLVQGTVSEKGRPESESAVCVPLVHRGQILGVINLIGAHGVVYSEYDLRAVSLFAEHAAIAVANARLYEAERALSAKLSHQVVHDPLTGAANRVLISDRLEHALARVRRGECAVAVLFIDIDNFKLVNDELGHRAGDFVLSSVAQRLSECVRPADTVGRFGGDEFVVVCEGLSHEGQAGEIAQRVLESLSRPFQTPFGDRTMSASIGVSVTDPSTEASAEHCIRAADRAMYRAKMEGKARVVSSQHPPVAAH